MTLQQFKQLEAGTVLYDGKYSSRRGRHETVIVIDHSKDGSGIVLRDDIGDSVYSYDNHWNYDVMPDDVSSLPFY